MSLEGASFFSMPRTDQTQHRHATSLVERFMSTTELHERIYAPCAESHVPTTQGSGVL